MNNKPKILIVFAKRGNSTSTRFGGFVKRIIENGGFSYADVEYVALEDLLFHIIDQDNTIVTDPIRNINVSDYSFVYFKSWQSMPEQAASLAIYLEAIGTMYADLQARHEYIAKTTNQMAMWANGVSVPETLWGEKQVLKSYLAGSHVKYPLIVKAVHGQKGKDNYLVYSADEAIKIIDTNEKDMMLQQHIPNRGDYRIGVYGHKARWAIYRKSSGTSHLNNTSAGGKAEYKNVSDIPKLVSELAERAAMACDLAISGVDVIEHKDTNKLYVLEANQGSQIVTGAYSDTNMTAFDQGIKDLIAKRYTPATNPKRIIGRRAKVQVKNGHNQLELIAKIDTGAFRSAIDASDITLHIDKRHKEYLSYTINSRTPGVKSIHIKTYDFDRATIRSSFGEVETRYVVPLHVEIQGITYTTMATLATRTHHKYSMLIGRKLLMKNFIVNVEYSEIEGGI